MIQLSIIIPHYNSVQLLKKLLESIPQEDEIEVIVIDDNSNKDLDTLHFLFNNSKFHRTKLVKNTTGKKGAGVCRNIGLEKSSGNWILFADSDDYFVADFYKKIKIFFTTNYELVYFTPISIELNTGLESIRHKDYEEIIANYLKKRDIKSELHLRHRYSVPWSKLIRKDLITDNKIYFDEVIASNDVMFSTKIGYYVQHFYVSKEVIYCVTRSKGSLTTQRSEEVFDARLMVFINHSKFLKSKLEKPQLDLLNRNGRGLLINVIKYNLGLKKFFSVLFQLKKNGIKVFDYRFINPFYVIRKAYLHYKDYSSNKSFFN